MFNLADSILRKISALSENGMVQRSVPGREPIKNVYLPISALEFTNADICRYNSSARWNYTYKFKFVRTKVAGALLRTIFAARTTRVPGINILSLSSFISAAADGVPSFSSAAAAAAAAFLSYMGTRVSSLAPPPTPIEFQPRSEPAYTTQKVIGKLFGTEC